MEKLQKYGVGVRKLDDPFFEPGNKICKMYIKKGIIDEDDEKLCHTVFSTFKCHIPGCSLKFDSLLDFEIHYNSCHRFSCNECKKQLPSPHLLDLHLSEVHDSFFKTQAERKPMYKCFVESCSVVNAGPIERRSHCIEAHKFPHDFRFDPVICTKMKTKKNTSKTEKMELGEEKACQNRKPNKKSVPFTFGHKSNIKSFPAKGNGKRSAGSKIEMGELMESLPS